MLYILPDSAGDLLVIQATGCLSEEDFKKTLLPSLTKQLDQYDKVRMLIYFDHNFETIEQHSSWDKASFNPYFSDKLSCLAVVSPTEDKDWLSSITDIQSDYFEEKDFLKALHWVDAID